MEISCDLSGRCSSVENYRLSILHHPSRCSSDRALSILVQKFTAAEINDCRRRRKSSSMHPLKAAFLGQLAKIAPNRIFGNIHLEAHLFSDDLAVLFEQSEDLLLAMGREHPARLYLTLHDTARYLGHGEPSLHDAYGRENPDKSCRDTLG